MQEIGFSYPQHSVEGFEAGGEDTEVEALRIGQGGWGQLGGVRAAKTTTKAHHRAGPARQTSNSVLIIGVIAFFGV